MTTVQFIVLLLIFAVFTVLIAHMVHYTHAIPNTYPRNYTNLRIMDCSDMYTNLTVMDLCYSKFRWEIDA